MASLKGVIVDVAADGGPDFLDVLPLRQVGFLLLEGPEPALDLDIVSPTALAVHTLVYMVLLEEFFVLLAGELAPLIRVQDLWSRHSERLLPSDVITTQLQLGSHLSGTPGRMIGVQVIDDLLAFQLCI